MRQRKARAQHDSATGRSVSRGSVSRGPAALPIAQANDPTPIWARPTRYSRRRAAVLASVYLLIGLHVAHWKIAGQTLAPLELNEVMYTLELGIVTAGFLFMLVACLATVVFGRFFCGWGCHILALEDLCAWLLARVRIRPKPVRSRLLLLVPPAAAFYMFLWPQVLRLWEGRPLPTAKVLTDAEGWASFLTSDFTRNLPGPGIAALTFLLCGFVIVYVLGSRSFCAYGCPYGAVFRVLDRAAPLRIVAAGDCANCGACTAVCPSHVRVHEELARYGTVVNPHCLKDLNCVAVCPQGNARYGLARPPLLRGWRATRSIRLPYDFTAAEEALLGAVFLAVFFVFRGLYDTVPFLMSIGLAAITAYLAVVVGRVLRRTDVRLAPVHLKRAGRLAPAGIALLGGAAAFAAFGGHSAFIRYHEFLGHRSAGRVERGLVAASSPADLEAAARDALRHLEACRRWGLLVSPLLRQNLAGLHEFFARRAAEREDLSAALAHYRAATSLRPSLPGLHYNMGVVLGALGRDAEAAAAYADAAARGSEDPDVFNNLGFTLIRLGEAAAAEEPLRRALALAPTHAAAHFNLGRALLLRGAVAEGREHLAAAGQLDPAYRNAPAAGDRDGEITRP